MELTSSLGLHHVTRLDHTTLCLVRWVQAGLLASEDIVWAHQTFAHS